MDPIRSSLVRLLNAALLLVGLAACASNPDPEVNDPIEPFNRAMFRVNTTLDKNMVVPVARAYRDGTPVWFQGAVRNGLDNLASPVVFANNLLQGDLTGGSVTLKRFIVNTIMGPLGFRDVALNKYGIEGRSEDFGQTLGVWGAKEGFYLVLPLLGPSNPRDLTGRVADIFLDPLFYVDYDHKIWVSVGRNTVDLVDQRSRVLDATEELERTSIDYYATVRSLYRQNRDNAIRNGEFSDEDLPQF